MSAVLAALAALFDFFDQMGRYLANQQLLDAGKAQEQVVAQQEVEVHVKQAQDAVDIPDAARTERLRDRFDDAAG